MHQGSTTNKYKKVVLTIGYQKKNKKTTKKGETGYDDTKQEGITTRSDLTPNQMKKCKK